MAVIKVPTNFNIDLEFEVPEFYRRLVALLIDWLLLYFYALLGGELVNMIIGDGDISNDSMRNYFALNLIIVVLPILIYHPLMEITLNGQSIGKKIMGLRVVNENGGRPSMSQFFIRWLLRDIWFIFLFTLARQAIFSGEKGVVIFIIIFTMAYFLAEIVMVVTSAKSQRIGDFLAHTIIIRTNRVGSIEDTVFQEVEDDYVPVFPQIMQLGDRDINSIKNILESARKKGDYEMADNAANKIKHHLGINTQIGAFNFLETLLKDYNYLSTK